MRPQDCALFLFLALFLPRCASAPGTPPAEGDPTAECPAGLPDCPTSAPSYQDVVEPIILSRCLGCHYQGNHNSSQVLETYEQVHASVSLVEKEVYRCEMPPSGEPSLNEDERAALLQWLVCGGPNN
ncbi:MAG TPA: hypothetical protein VGQ57_07080 [Polyangiaceae bacterium]|nr:hypothetical protein [Polyangiaceae bacterium]